LQASANGEYPIGFVSTKIQHEEHSLTDTTGRILESEYDEDSDSASENLQDLSREIIQSYTILFTHQRDACRLYRNQERAKATVNKWVDPSLDDLCGYNEKRVPFRMSTAWDSAVLFSNFPILFRRFHRLQEYMKGREARGIKGLYRDTRNSYLRYTFWAVILLTLLNLGIATGQIILSGLQLSFAREANVLAQRQLDSSSNCSC
jgi:hypothetical protein